jgi:hypothetical protein
VSLAVVSGISSGATDHHMTWKKGKLYLRCIKVQKLVFFEFSRLILSSCDAGKFLEILSKLDRYATRCGEFR